MIGMPSAFAIALQSLPVAGAHSGPARVGETKTPNLRSTQPIRSNLGEKYRRPSVAPLRCMETPLKNGSSASVAPFTASRVRKRPTLRRILLSGLPHWERLRDFLPPSNMDHLITTNALAHMIRWSCNPGLSWSVAAYAPASRCVALSPITSSEMRPCYHESLRVIERILTWNHEPSGPRATIVRRS